MIQSMKFKFADHSFEITTPDGNTVNCIVSITSQGITMVRQIPFNKLQLWELYNWIGEQLNAMTPGAPVAVRKAKP